MRLARCLFPILLGILVIFGGGWGPITHTHIAQESAEEVSIKFGATALRYYIGGSVMPDWSHTLGSVNADFNGWPSKFASFDYWGNMWELADNENERAFCLGWLSHITVDPIEGIYSTSKIKAGAPFSADFAVDLLIGNPQRIRFSVPYKLMIDAWKATYPGEPLVPARGQIFRGERMIKIYLAIPSFIRYRLCGVTKKEALIWYSDYEGAYNQSVEAATEALREYW
jgi:hypothetical protein